jgi:hypothetical protein
MGVMQRALLRSATRRASIACLASLACIVLQGCRMSAPPTTSLHLHATDGTPLRARVTIDDQPLGTLDFIQKRGVAMPPGKHRITIEADGYLPWDSEVDAGPSGGVVPLDVTLVPIPD